MLLELVVVELEVPEPLGDGLEPELDDVPLDPEDPALESLDGWLPEPLEPPVALLGASSVVIGFADVPLEVVFCGAVAAGGLAALPSVGSTTSG